MKQRKIIIMSGIIILFSNTVLCHAKAENEISKGKIQYIIILNKDSVKLGWERINKAKKYQIQYSSNKNMKNSVTKIVKKSRNCKIYQLKDKKTYYFRVRGIRGKMKGQWSKIKK